MNFYNGKTLIAALIILFVTVLFSQVKEKKIYITRDNTRFDSKVQADIYDWLETHHINMNRDHIRITSRIVDENKEDILRILLENDTTKIQGGNK